MASDQLIFLFKCVTFFLKNSLLFYAKPIDIKDTVLFRLIVTYIHIFKVKCVFFPSLCH